MCPEPAQSVVLVDDDVSLNRLVSQYLGNQGFEVTVVTDGLDAIARIAAINPDIVILDVMLPGADGLTVCRKVRQSYNGPILMLTALGDDIDEVAGLETGADDYLAKPVRPRVLLARIRVLLRRMSTAVGVRDGAQQSLPDISIADFNISPTAMRVTCGSDVIALTNAEFDLLYLLAQHAGTPLSRDAINQTLRGVEHDGLDRSIDLRISRLRKKLGDDPKDPKRIKSVRGKGYQLTL
ncbi:MAG: response regulator [Granulosicoccus sp.]